MNVKKLAIIGAIALVIIGCILAAGCTSPNTETNSDEHATGYVPLDDTKTNSNEHATGYVPLDDTKTNSNEHATGYIPLN